MDRSPTAIPLRLFLLMLPSALAASGCHPAATWRDTTNLPTFEGGCIELTQDCAFSNLDGSLHYLDDKPESFKTVTYQGSLPRGQHLKVTFIGDDSETGLLVIYGTVEGGPFNDERMYITDLFNNAVTSDGKKIAYALHKSARRCDGDRLGATTQASQ